MYRQNPEPVSAQTVFFVMYNRKTTLVTAIFESSSQELLELYQQSDIFRGTCFNESTFLPTTLSNNKYAQEIIHHQMYTVKKARNGGAIQAVRRVCSTLPMNPQSFIDSPFFDHNLFNYDEKAITSADRSRLCTDFPVKFYDRKNGRLKFTLDYNDQPGMPQPLGSNRGQKKAVNFVFHPTEPFVITIQYSNLQVAVVNIHCRT